MKNVWTLLFVVICSVLLDSIIVAFLFVNTYFNNDRIKKYKPVPSPRGSIGGLSPPKLKYETL